MAIVTTCPFCFHRIDSPDLGFQCSGRGNATCPASVDPERVKLTGDASPSFRYLPPPPRGRRDYVICEMCGGETRRRACPTCHTALPVDFAGSRNVTIGLVGSKGSGKTVLMTVLVQQLREILSRRYDADIRIVTDHPDGQQTLSDYKENREKSLFSKGLLPSGTATLAARGHATPIVLHWRSRKSTMLSFVDSAGEDLSNTETAFTLRYLSVCDSLIITLDPFAVPGARARINLPVAARMAGDVTLDVVGRITEILRAEYKIKGAKKIDIPVAIVFTKIDAFYSMLDRNNPIMAAAPAVPAYDDADGEAVHEHMLALLSEWGADDLDRHMRLNYTNYRYFPVSALGAEPNYADGEVAVGGVQPHRVEDPVLWLMYRHGTVKSV